MVAATDQKVSLINLEDKVLECGNEKSAEGSVDNVIIYFLLFMSWY